jgi:hypothetical protein
MNTEELLETWRQRAQKVQRAHYRSASRLESLNLWLGIPVIVLNTMIGGGIFAILEEQLNIQAVMKIVVATLSITAAILVSLQTFLRPAERAERHRQFAYQFGEMQREIERYQSFGLPTSQDPSAFFEAIDNRWNELVKDSPLALESAWREAENLRQLGKV